MDFVADESVDFRIVTYLRKSGYTVYSIAEDSFGISDEVVLKKAVESKSVLITEDKDFGELTFRLKRSHNGIILIRMPGIPIETRIEKIGFALNEFGGRLQNSFTVITVNKLRIKALF